MVWDLVISMMTEKDFWDKFHSKHNSKYFYDKKNKKKTEKQKNNSIKFKIFRKSD